MATFYVETYRPAYPARGVKVRVHREKDYSIDCLSPGMTSVFRVEMVNTKEDAIACVAEHAAGHGVCVRCVHGGVKRTATAS